MSKNSYSFCLVGGQSLLTQCGDRLLQGGHAISAVISADSTARNWARQQNLDHYNNEEAFLEQSDKPEFDYLLSIVNLQITSTRLLEAASLCAINFHDGRLPDYAGLNVTSWALLNNEAEHSVTWHEMLEEVDQGRIFVERAFPIPVDATAFTLNALCFETARETFSELLQKIENGQLAEGARKPGSGTLFRRSRRPEQAGLIRWDQPADTISALVRSMDYGPYPNPLYAAKTLFGDRPFVVQGIAVTDEPSSLEPGTVVAVDGNKVTVATADRNIVLDNFYCLAGKPHSPQDLPLAPSDRFRSPGEGESSALTRLGRRTASREPFWARRLAGLDPAELPYASPRPAGSGDRGAYGLRKPAVAPANLGCEELIGATLGYLARITGKSTLMAGLSLPDTLPEDEVANDLFSEMVPLEIALNASTTFSRFLDSAREELDRCRDRRTFALDILYRQPNLRAAASQWLAGPKPLAVATGDRATDRQIRSAALLIFVPETGGELHLHYDKAVYTQDAIGKIGEQLEHFIASCTAAPDAPLVEISLLPESEQAQIAAWNSTAVEFQKELRVHELFEQQVERTPDAQALSFESSHYSYRELNEAANRLCGFLIGQGVRHQDKVGILLDRSADMVIALLAVLKAGAAYVPLDPVYPAERLRYMVEDSGLHIVVTESRYVGRLQLDHIKHVALDENRRSIDGYAVMNMAVPGSSDDLAYLIYTSGSTGKPKGVMVGHRNVHNFFVGMDPRIAGTEPGTWLALTSISFDISVLELLWTLSRGYHVILHDDQGVRAGKNKFRSRYPNQGMDFSLFYWNHTHETDKAEEDAYGLFFESAEFGDRNGFKAVWTPERHFQSFGGLFPNPSVIGAAIAARTENLEIRSGSCLAPLHSPIRIAEEWAVVDNISGGRVGLGMAPGWQPTDFAIRPDAWKNSKEVLYENIETVQRLWAGEKVPFQGPEGEVAISTLPRPIRKELPIWLTIASNPESYRQAGARGYGVLTHLLGQSVEEVGEKIKSYRKARKEAGHPGEGHVTVMLHTLVGDDEDAVKELVRQPMKDYLRSAVFLVKDAAWNFPTFQKLSKETGQTIDEFFANAGPEDMDAILEFAFERYFQRSGLLGSVEKCVAMVDRIKEIGAQEIGCLIDFGAPRKQVMAHLPHLAEVLRLSASRAAGEDADFGIPALIDRHKVTHMQCTPSQAKMLAADSDMHASLGALSTFMVGGEALPPELAEELGRVSGARLINMYGPTETTIWSSTQELDGGDGPIPIGTPIANTSIYILDEHHQPVPIGVPGELVIGGDGVVPGYHQRSELTAERFLPDPFSGQENATMYRTGDMARWRDDGVVEFLGRMDFQVKIRGYRIELGEIESGLQAHESVEQAVVLLREDVPGDKRLIAYILPAMGYEIDEQELKQALLKEMPDFMVPSGFVVLDSIPLTLNGKIDRKALPAPVAPARADSSGFEAPASDTELMVATIWKKALKREDIGLDDNFFDIGGHSLLAIEVLQTLREQAGKPIQMTTLFQYTTVRTLARFLSGDQDDGQGAADSKARADKRRAAMGRRRRRN